MMGAAVESDLAPCLRFARQWWATTTTMTMMMTRTRATVTATGCECCCPRGGCEEGWWSASPGRHAPKSLLKAELRTANGNGEGAALFHAPSFVALRAVDSGSGSGSDDWDLAHVRAVPAVPTKVVPECVSGRDLRPSRC